MDKFEKITLSMAMVLVVIFIASILFAKDVSGIDLPDCIPYDAKYATPKVEQLDDSTVQAFYVAKMWGYEPSVIEINRGTTVDFYLSSKDVVHGFKVEGTNINLMAIPGNVNKFTHHFDKKGVYDIVCHEYCGVFHQNMMGQIIVR